MQSHPIVEYVTDVKTLPATRKTSNKNCLPGEKEVSISKKNTTPQNHQILTDFTHSFNSMSGVLGYAFGESRCVNTSISSLRHDAMSTSYDAVDSGADFSFFSTSAFSRLGITGDIAAPSLVVR